MVFGREYLKALKYLAHGKRPKTAHPVGCPQSFHSKSLSYSSRIFFSYFLLFLAAHPPLVSLAALEEGAALSQDDSLVPSEQELRAIYKELSLECSNASFRIQYYYNQRRALIEQIGKVTAKLDAHYPSV